MAARLTEILCTLAPLSIALTMVLTVITFVTTGLTQTDQQLYAMTAINRQMERVRDESFATLAGWTPSTTFTDGLLSLPNSQGRIYVEPYGGRADCLKVTVTVSIGANRIWRATTLVTR